MSILKIIWFKIGSPFNIKFKTNLNKSVTLKGGYMFVSKGEHWDKNLTSAMGEISRGG